MYACNTLAVEEHEREELLREEQLRLMRFGSRCVSPVCVCLNSLSVVHSHRFALRTYLRVTIKEVAGCSKKMGPRQPTANSGHALMLELIKNLVRVRPEVLTRTGRHHYHDKEGARMSPETAAHAAHGAQK